MGSDGFKMRAEDLKAVLRKFANELSVIVKDDIENIEVHEDWSNIPFVLEHLEFLIDQTKGLSDSLRNKEQENAEEQQLQSAQE